MSDWIDVAVLAHTKNLNGGLVARSASGLSLLLDEGMEVALVPPVLDAPRDVTVASVDLRGAAEALVFFNEVRDAHVADALGGCHCLGRKADVAEDLLALEQALTMWAGWEALDASAGFSGEVVGVEERPVQSLLVLRRADGAEVYVPLVDEFISQVDEEARCINLNCPAGLFEL